jgi:hypothetical protein
MLTYSMKKTKFLITLLMCSCASVPDVPVITRTGPTTGYYVYTVSDKEGYVDDENLLEGKTFLDFVVEGVIVPADSYSEIKSAILKACKKLKCSGDVGKWKSKLDKLE